jgi:hypothetical protein
MQDGAGGASRMEVRGVVWRVAAKMSGAISTAILAELAHLLIAIHSEAAAGAIHHQTGCDGYN